MFVGHFAVAFAAKRAAPAISLGTWFIACELVDVIWPLFLLAGIESARVVPGITAFSPLEFDHYPWTHSLAMCVGWALAMAALFWAQNRFAATVIGLVVLSHWFLDAIVHRPDLPLVPGGDTRIGLALWNSVAGTLAVELALFAAGLGVYLAGSRALDSVGRWGLWAIVAFLLLAYAGAAFGPPPPDLRAVAIAGLLGAATTAALGYWVDRHRAVRI